MAKVEGEQAKVSVRHARKLAMDGAKKLASEDERKRVEKEVQRVTDEYITQVGCGGWRRATKWWLLGWLAWGQLAEQLHWKARTPSRCFLLSAVAKHAMPTMQASALLPSPQIDNMVAKKEKSIKSHDS